MFDTGSNLPAVALLGNYPDTIPQDLFHLKEGTLSEVLCTVRSGDPADAPPADRLNRLDLDYSTRPLTNPPHGDRLMVGLLEWYRRHLRESFVLVPSAAFATLDHFRAVGGRSLLGLFADKGRWLPEDLEGAGPRFPPTTAASRLR